MPNRLSPIQDNILTVVAGGLCLYSHRARPRAGRPSAVLALAWTISHIQGLRHAFEIGGYDMRLVDMRLVDWGVRHEAHEAPPKTEVLGFVPLFFEIGPKSH